MSKFVQKYSLISAQFCCIFLLLICFTTPCRAFTEKFLRNDYTQEYSIRDFIKAAKEQTKLKIKYDPSYYQLRYPGGDVPNNKGACTDFVIRAFRKAGIDLQKEVFKHMAICSELYLKTKRNTNPDVNIDHRRVKNLMVFFKHKAKELPVSKNPTDFLPGDIVVWKIKRNLHMGIVVDVPSNKNKGRYMIAHHSFRKGPKIQDILFSFKMIGHYRYF